MPTQRATEIANAFTKYAKTGDKSLIKEFTREEIEATLLQYHLDKGWAHYIAMEKRIEELKEGQRSSKKTDKKWYEKTEIQVALIVGLFTLLAAFISAPHWWPWSKQAGDKTITSEQLSNDQSKDTSQGSSSNAEKRYFIFVKSFYDDVKARRLVNLLRANNFDSDMRHIVGQNADNRFEVFVGYFNTYDEAKLNADRIQLELGYWTVIKSDVKNKE